MTDTQREKFEAAVVQRLKESGFLEIEIRTEALVRCDDGYQDEVINAGWHYWNAALIAAGKATGAPPPPSSHLMGDPVGLKPIPIEAAKRIAKEYGYDQVLIYGRRCHDTPEPHGEHMTTYGRTREHCDVAARIGDTLKKFMGWEV